MDRIVFKQKIDSIYEKLYSINERLSSFDSKEFIRGFQDGIKEGYKWFNRNINTDINEWNPFKAAAGAVGSVVGGAKGLYNQGKQLATKAWNTVAEFTTGVVNKIKTGIETAATWISEQPGKIKDYLTGIYNQAVSDMKSAYESLKDKAQELATAITNIWNQIITSIKTSYETAKQKIIANQEAAKKWFETNKQLIITQAKELQQSTIAWLKQAGTTALDVINQLATDFGKILKGVGVCIGIILIGPIYLLVKGVMALPELYKLAQKQVEAGFNQLEKFWEQLGEEYNAGINKGLSATTPSVGKIPVRDPKTGKMMPSGTVPEHNILRFSEFVNEKKKMNKEEFLEMIGKGKKSKDKCGKCHKKKCECE